MDVSHLIFQEVKAEHDELSTQEPLDQRYVEDDVEKVQSVAQHQLVGPRVVAAIEILEIYRDVTDFIVSNFVERFSILQVLDEQRDSVVVSKLVEDVGTVE